jgi:hypothetical protein
MAFSCQLRANHASQGVIVHHPLPWWPQPATCVMEALPHEPKPAARGSLEGLELSWARSHGPICLRSCGHKGCLAFKRQVRRRPKPPCLRGSVICSRTAPFQRSWPMSVKALSTMWSAVSNTASAMESHSATHGRCATLNCSDPCKRSQCS